MGGGKELSASEEQEVEKAANAEPWVHKVQTVLLTLPKQPHDVHEPVFSVSPLYNVGCTASPGV